MNAQTPLLRSLSVHGLMIENRLHCHIGHGMPDTEISTADIAAVWRHVLCTEFLP